MPPDKGGVVLLGGGIGCSRLAVPLARALAPGGLTVVVNTADDLWRYGLRICPDLDTNLYALAGWSDRERGWGLAGDTFVAMEHLRRYGEDPWFGLGDRDLATHLLRTSWMAEGRPLSWVTAALAERAGVSSHLVPMCDQEVDTRVTTAEGELGFQEYFVHRGARDPVLAVHYEGIADTSPAPGVIEALATAEVVVLGPSSPVASIEPILAVAGTRDAVAAARRGDGGTGRRSRVVAVTPVVRGVAITDEGEALRARSRAAMLAAEGADHSASAVARRYTGLADVFVLDEADADEADAIATTGMEVVVAPTLVTCGATGARGDEPTGSRAGSRAGTASDEESGDRLAQAVLTA